VVEKKREKRKEREHDDIFPSMKEKEKRVFIV